MLAISREQPPQQFRLQYVQSLAQQRKAILQYDQLPHQPRFAPEVVRLLRQPDGQSLLQKQYEPALVEQTLLLIFSLSQHE